MINLSTWRAFQSRIATGVCQLQSRWLTLLHNIGANLAFALTYVPNKIREEHCQVRELAVTCAATRLDLVRIRLDACPGHELSKLRKDIAEVLDDLARLRQDTSDGDLDDLVRTRLNDLKFQFHCALALHPTLMNLDDRQDTEDLLDAANVLFAV
jgi:hypothetical protein